MVLAVRRAGRSRLLAGSIVVLGAAAVLAATLADAHYRLHGPVSPAVEPEDANVAAFGDVNGDGVRDFAIGYPVNANEAGYVVVTSSADGSPIHTLHGSSSVVGLAGTYFGSSVAGVRDLDGDGVDDVLVAEPRYADATHSGAVHVYSGASGDLIRSILGDGGAFATAIGTPGDVDGDGSGDIAVGDPMAHEPVSQEQRGALTVYSGASGALLYTVYGDNANDRFGSSVCRLGDVDGDHVDDFAVGAREATDAGGHPVGSVRVVSGATGATIRTLHGDATGPSGGLAWFGSAVAGPGDVDADGVPDLAVGAPLGSDDQGAQRGYVRVFSGKDWSVIWTKYGGANSELGTSLASGIDFDNDGAQDLVVGAKREVNAASAAAGAVHVLSGRTSEELGSVVGDAAKDLVGQTVGQLGDVDGDGAIDVVFAIPGDQSSVGSTSSVVVMSMTGPVPPRGTVRIAGGAAATNDTAATLSLTWASPVAQVTDVQIRNRGSEWSAFMPVAATLPWALEPGEGTKTVDVQFRDSRGSLSPIASATIVLDTTPPSGTVSIQDGSPWTASRDVSLALDSTDVGGGVTQVRVRDGGGQFGPWVDAGPTTPWTLSAGPGVKTVEVEFRDAAGNESEIASDTIVLLGASLPVLPSGGTATGALAVFDEVDGVAIDLLAGDKLTVALTAKAGVKKSSFVLALDLAGPDGTRLFAGAYPESSKKARVRGFVAPTSGRYSLVVRHADAVGTPIGTYALAISVVRAKSGISGKGKTTTGDFFFEGLTGATFSAVLKGDLLQPVKVRIDGPNGQTIPTLTVRPDSTTVQPFKLSQGSGTYHATFASTGPVTYTWKAVFPKKGKIAL
jgi:hypothetical protein